MVNLARCFAMYLRNVPENSTGSCGMIATLERSFSNDSIDVSTPSIEISPSIQANRNIAPINELLPNEEISVFNAVLVSVIDGQMNREGTLAYLRLFCRQCQFFPSA